MTREVTVGEPLMVLEIESRTASLVVVGSRGLGAFGSLLLGSTAVRLTARGRCPVVVVRGRPDPSGPVLLAVDGSSAGEGAVESAFAEASPRGADMVAPHVWNTWSERAYEGPGDPLNAVVDIERLRQEEQQLLDGTRCVDAVREPSGRARCGGGAPAVRGPRRPSGQVPGCGGGAQGDARRNAFSC